MSFFQQPYNHQFPQLGPKNTSTSPVPQHKIYQKKTNPSKPFEHLPNIWLFGQGVLRHDGNWEYPPWFGILEAIFIKTFGSNGALTSVICVTYSDHLIQTFYEYFSCLFICCIPIRMTWQMYAFWSLKWLHCSSTYSHRLLKISAI